MSIADILRQLTTPEALAGSVAGVAGLFVAHLLLTLLLWRRVRGLSARLRALGDPAGEMAAGSDFVTLRARIARVEARLDSLEQRHQASLQRVGLVRFNAFSDVGGERSFALALLDDHGDGLVLTSVSTREQSWTYAKPVRGGASNHPLSEEERRAIAQAMAAESDVGQGLAGRR